MSEAAAYLKYHSLNDSRSPTRVATLVINRPQAANSFNGELLDQLTALITEVSPAIIRAGYCCFKALENISPPELILAWMKAAANLDYQGNRQEAEKLRRMFEMLHQLPIPTVAVVNGSAFGGGVGLIAACDYAIAVDSAKICLSEVKIGLVPAVILPYLARKIQKGQLNRIAMTGKIFSATEAKEMGLVQIVTSAENLNAVLLEETNMLLQGSPEAQKLYKSLERNMQETGEKQSDLTVAAIAKIRASTSGQSGLEAFFAQQPPPWVETLPNDTNILP